MSSKVAKEFRLTSGFIYFNLSLKSNQSLSELILAIYFEFKINLPSGAIHDVSISMQVFALERIMKLIFWPDHR